MTTLLYSDPIGQAQDLSFAALADLYFDALQGWALITALDAKPATPEELAEKFEANLASRCPDLEASYADWLANGFQYVQPGSVQAALDLDDKVGE